MFKQLFGLLAVFTFFFPVIATRPRATERAKLLLTIPEGAFIEYDNIVWRVIRTENGPKESILYFYDSAVDEILINNDLAVEEFTRNAIVEISPDGIPSIFPTISGSLINSILTAENTREFKELVADNLWHSKEILETVANEIQEEAKTALESLGINSNAGLSNLIRRSLGPQNEM
jgi:hypothetical protein